MQCFCGCGQKVKFSMRAINKRGAIISGDLWHVRTLMDRGLNSPNAEAFLHDGELFCEALATAVHAGQDPGRELEAETRGFMRFGRQHYSASALGAAVRRSGMTVDEAVQAISEGRWDPFADAEIPQ